MMASVCTITLPLRTMFWEPQRTVFLENQRAVIIWSINYELHLIISYRLTRLPLAWNWTAEMNINTNIWIILVKYEESHNWTAEINILWGVLSTAHLPFLHIRPCCSIRLPRPFEAILITIAQHQNNQQTSIGYDDIIGRWFGPKWRILYQTFRCFLGRLQCKL